MISITAAQNRNLVLRTGIIDGNGGREYEDEAAETIGSSNEISELHGRMCLELHDKDNAMKNTFSFDGPFTFNRDENRIYVCMQTDMRRASMWSPEDEGALETSWRYKPSNIDCYEIQNDGCWKYLENIGTTDETVFVVYVSHDENLVATTHVYGYRVFNRKLGKVLNLQLEPGLRNIPNRKRIAKLVVFTRDGKYVVTAVKDTISVWCSQTGVLKKTFNAHVKRIVDLIIPPFDNKVISSSMDNTIKIWNFDNIHEKMFPLDRHEKKIETISVAAHAAVAIATTRSTVGVWNLHTGRLEKNLVACSHTTLITKAIITKNGKTVVTGESCYVHFWDVESGKIIKSDPQSSVQQFLLIENESRILTLSRETREMGLVICRHMPNGAQGYDPFRFKVKRVKDMVLSCDGLYIIIPAINESNDPILKVFHAKTGTFLYDMVLDYDNYKDFTHIVAMPHDASLVGIVDPGKTVLWDVKQKCFVRAIKQWNGICSKDGQSGLLAPSTGGLMVMNLQKKQSPHRQLFGMINEGMFSTKAFFINHDRHILYYHGRRNLIKIVRTSDGKQIAEYCVRGEGVCVFEAVDDGAKCILVLGIYDGSVITLMLADPTNQTSVRKLAVLPSRVILHKNLGNTECKYGIESVAEKKESSPKISFKTAVRATITTNKARKAMQSKACVIS